ncbi:MAG: ATP-dependent helicase [Spirochaetes bacterium]|nr:ATP-dependent helicase [Spirochaetota bacterium]
MNKLNKKQHKASLPVCGIELVIAGAGTGKTKTLIEKVNNILRSNTAKPAELLILTFSNKAAQEIKDRVQSQIGMDAERIISGTFHSFCLGFLRRNSRLLFSEYGYKIFPEIIDNTKKTSIRNNFIREFLPEFYGLPMDIISGLLENTISLSKKMYRKLYRLGIIDELKKIENKFMEYKILNNLIDFGDMIDFTVEILEKDKKIREDVHKSIKYIFVDEFQDTSEDNFRLIKLLLNKKNPNLFLVGDDWQSIYGFRGAKIDYLINMKKYFSKVKIHKLDKNYRSKKEIVKLSNKFIRTNKYRTGKKLKSFKGRGGIIRNFSVESFAEEAEVITAILKSKEFRGQGTAAILYRNNRQGSFLSERLKPDDLHGASVKLMTMHASKGLEFDSVIIAGLSDEIIPDTSTDIEEERRLLYVALTRAMEKLYIIHHKTNDGGLSRFAEELGFS